MSALNNHIKPVVDVVQVIGVVYMQLVEVVQVIEVVYMQLVVVDKTRYQLLGGLLPLVQMVL
jgi:hypothetical protein